MTTISSVSVTSSDSLLAKLESNGLSASKAQLVEDDLSQVAASAGLGTSASASSPVDMQTMRAALDKKIDDDVSSGKLSQSDAAAVKKTLDQMDSQTGGTGQTQAAATTSQSSGSGAAQASSDSGGAKGGGGGGGASSKTEVSEAVTITGPLKTTVITYSDGSTASTTTVATDTDEQKYGKQQASQDSAATNSTATNTAAMKYLSTVAPGTLFNQMA